MPHFRHPGHRIHQKPSIGCSGPVAQSTGRGRISRVGSLATVANVEIGARKKCPQKTQLGMHFVFKFSRFLQEFLGRYAAENPFWGG